AARPPRIDPGGTPPQPEFVRRPPRIVDKPGRHSEYRGFPEAEWRPRPSEECRAVVPSVMPTYGRIDIAFERGEGPYLFATDGRRFLDFASGIATNSLGHAHPHLVRAIAEQ